MRYLTLFFRATSALTALLTIAVVSCQPRKQAAPPLVVREDTAAASKAATIRENTPVQLAPGLSLTLWASDSLAPDPIAMSIDDEGRVYLTRTNRQKNSEFDIRGHQDWMIPSIALQTVEDRRAFLRKTFAPEKSDENKWLNDLNGDGVHDWNDLAVEQEEVWRLEDVSGDGYADRATRILRDFHDEVTDVAGALLVRDDDMFVGVGPDMWRLTDTDGDGIPDEKKSISHGYAVHIGFSGHGMSGVIEGPDGKIYWGIGDIGANITTDDGTVHRYPNQGVIVRSNPDGSNFEVFAAGLRNTHEFVFDEFGNLISADNDGDHPGERERLVHIVEGADAGWRSNWQYGKYVDPKNNSYKVWMDEQLFKPRWEGQAAYIIPPLANFHNGPTGMVYNPGTALGSEWKNSFFLVEFVGNPSRSHIWNFKLKPEGASFALAEERDVLSGILPTGIRFGPDGALYIADWINGWGTKNYGRVWKMDVTSDKRDLAAERSATRELMQLDYTRQTGERLLELLSFADMRVRQKAQGALALRGGEGKTIFEQALKGAHQLARVHAIWGIGQLAASDKQEAAVLASLLSHQDPETIAQAAKVIGDVRYDGANEQLITLLRHPSPRVVFFSAQALGRLKHQPAVPALIDMLSRNNDADVYLRHAGVLALARIGDADPVVALAESPVKALRTAAVLVLRRLGDERVQVFLKDQDEYIATEAARAINDDWSIEKALPALAAVLEEKRFTSEPLLRRAINAASRVGGEKEMQLLIDFAADGKQAAALRAEALSALATWPSPSVLDRVDGRYRGEVTRSADTLKVLLADRTQAFLNGREPEVVIASLKVLQGLEMNGHEEQVARMLASHPSPEVRAAALTTLNTLRYENMEAAIKRGMADRDEVVRTAALALLDKLDIRRENLMAVVDPVFANASIPEQQQLLKVLGEMPPEQTTPVFEGLIARYEAGKLSPGLALDLIEAIDATESPALMARVDALRKKGTGTDAYRETLAGGDERKGRQYFYRNPTGQCVRCHAVGGSGGEVGPDLTHIGDVLSREQLLEALVEPSKRLSPGYGSVTLTLTDGQEVSGILLSEDNDHLLLKTSEAEPMEVPVARISSRENLPSSMPPMGSLMSKREIRDVIEFLSGLRE